MSAQGRGGGARKRGSNAQARLRVEGLGSWTGTGGGAKKAKELKKAGKEKGRHLQLKPVGARLLPSPLVHHGVRVGRVGRRALAVLCALVVAACPLLPRPSCICVYTQLFCTSTDMRRCTLRETDMR